MDLPDASGYEGPLAEYVALRTEIDRRSSEQQTLFAGQLTFAGALFGFALVDPMRISLLLILPPLAYALCFRYVTHSSAIFRIGIYIKDELSQKIPGGLGWEAWARSHPLQKSVSPARLAFWALPIVFIFPGSGLLGLALTFSHVFLDAQSLRSRIALEPLWCIGAALSLTSVYSIAVNNKYSQKYQSDVAP